MTSHETNLQYLNRAVFAYLEHQKSCTIERKDPGTPSIEKKLSEPRKRRKVQMNAELEDAQSVPCESHHQMIKTEKLEQIPFGQSLFQVLPQSPECSLSAAAENDCKDFLNEKGGHLAKLHCARETSVMNSMSGAFVEQKNTDCSASSPQTVICTNDLLDCVLNPQVISLLAHLLLERVSV